MAARFRRTNTWWCPTWLQPPQLAGRDTTHALYTRFDAFNHLFWADSAAAADLSEHLRGVGRGANVRASAQPESPLPFAGLRFPRPSGAETPDTAGYLYVVRNTGLPILAGTDLLRSARGW